MMDNLCESGRDNVEPLALHVHSSCIGIRKEQGGSPQYNPPCFLRCDYDRQTIVMVPQAFWERVRQAGMRADGLHSQDALGLQSFGRQHDE